MTLTYGQITRDPAKLPVASQVALMQRGLAHLCGNEQASRVVGLIRAEIAGKDGKVADVTKEQVQAFRAANAEWVSARTTECINEALKELDEGTLGTRAVGVRVDPMTAALNTVARADVVATLKANGIKVPKGQDEKVKFADGREKTMADMIATRLSHPDHGPRLKKEAERKIADDARRAKAAAAAVEANKGKKVDSTALGL